MKTTLVSVVFLLSGVCGQWLFDPHDLPSMPNTNSNHTCRMWGQCYFVNGLPKICEYSGAPVRILHDGLSQEVHDEVLNILENRCSFLLQDEDGNRADNDEVYTCCSAEQLIGMAESFLLADGVLARCPTCLRNFVRQICEMNCSPEQSRFLDVYTAEGPNDIVYVDEVDYRMHEDFMLGSHSSCAGVLVPQTGMPAINLMCGNAPVCDAQAWYGFSGDVVNNPFTPTQVNFISWPTPEDSMNARAMPCNETAEGDYPCSCVDCLATCPAGQVPYVNQICTVMSSVNCVGFIIGIIFFVITVVIFSLLTLLDYRRTKSKPNESDKPECNIPVETKTLTAFFERLFSSIASFSTNHPVAVIMITTWFVFIMYFGLLQIKITANPIEIWSAPGSRSRNDFDYYNSRFGPFHRTAQVFLRFNGLEPFVVDNVTYGPAFRVEALQELLDLERAILNVGRDNGGVVLEQVCFAPTNQPGSEVNVDQCTTMSAATYIGADRIINNATYLNRVLGCLNNYYALDCLAPWGGGSEPEIAFGGYEGDDIYSADTLVLSLPLVNHLLERDLVSVMQWEQQFLDLMLDYIENWKSEFVDISYSTERSIEDEIQRVSEAEVIPIAASYVLMFLYVTLALGKVKSCKTCLIGSKVLVAIASILIEVLAIYCALCSLGYMGIPTTLLAINVIPFFVLSVGIDNVFLMVNTLEEVNSNLQQYKDYKDDFDFQRKRSFVFKKMMERVGPSIFITSVTQITCFAIGTVANFPAVQTFAVFASLALAYLFLFQMTTIVGILSLDFKREAQNRLDILFCVQKKILDDESPLTSDQPYRSITQRFMGPYSKFIVNWKVKIVVAILSMAVVSTSVILIPQLEIGLDQQMVLPTDSYVYKYLESVKYLFKLGPPVMFVLKSGLNFTDPLHQNVICGGQMCNDDSLITQIFLASLHSEITHIDRSSNSWLDDFFDWSSLHQSCCRYQIEDDSFCSSSNMSNACAYCSIPMDDFGIRPLGEAFEKYIPFFLQDAPTDICNKGGLASYNGNVNYELDAEGRATVQDSNFMAYHTGLSTSEDYITAVKYGYELSENITGAIRQHTGLDVEVVPYSIFYPFYEQYLTMWGDTFESIAYCMIGVLVITLLTSALNWLTTFAVMFTTVLVVIDMMGLMYIWNIPLNAVSCVNLIVSIGISVEFCSHIAYAFATSSCPPRYKVADAIKKVGATIVTGITFTNIPIIVLAFSYTELIEVFFFRMFFGLVIIGFFHGMVFLPVFLSFLVNINEK